MPPGFTDADLAVFDQGTVVFFRAGDALVETGRIALPGAGPEMYQFDGAWLDHDSLVASRGPFEVLRLSKDGVIPLAVPAPAMFSTARPADAGPDIEDASDGDGVGGMLGAHDGAAYWSQCAWRTLERSQCVRWVDARVWPTPARAEADLPELIAEAAWPAAVPVGFTIQIDDDVQALSCRAPGAKAATRLRGGPGGIYDARWVSADPARLLVVFGVFAYASTVPDTWALYDGCAATPLAAGTSVTPGPVGLWAGTSSSASGATTVTIFRGAAEIGAAPVSSRAIVRFRPR